MVGRDFFKLLFLTKIVSIHSHILIHLETTSNVLISMYLVVLLGSSSKQHSHDNFLDIVFTPGFAELFVLMWSK